jgi:hypothetical protein
MHFLLGFLLFICVGCSTFHSRSITNQLQKQLSKIPFDDQKKLEMLFQKMMTGDYFAGTLFGKKPLTFQEFHDDPWKLSSYAMVNPYYYFYLDEGWQTWLKYRELFPSQHFIFTKISSQKGGYEFLILINKTAFKEMFDGNYDLFEQELGPSITMEKILQDFENQQKDFFKILNNHEGLVGLILGYGREGSMQVHLDWALKLQILRNTLYPLSPPMPEHKLLKKILTSVKFQEKKLAQRGTKWHQIFPSMMPVEDPYAELNKKNQVCDFLLPSWQERVSHILSPNFTIVKGSEEAKQLKKEYAIALQKARETFKTKSFLRAFLEQYCINE